MVNILRAMGLTCAMLIATVSLYFFTVFWTGVGTSAGYDKTIIEISQQATSFANPIRKFCRDKLAYLKQKV